MSNIEHNILDNYIDSDGNTHVLFPITKVENIIGLDQSRQRTVFSTTVTVPASAWSGTVAPYSATIPFIYQSKIPITNAIINLDINASTAQFSAAAAAELRLASLTSLKAYGEKPTVALPLSIMVF